MYLLDTNICIYIIKKQPSSVLKRFEQLSVGAVAMSVVTFGELEYGAAKSNNSAKAHGILQELVNYIPVLPMESAGAQHYANIRAVLEKLGTPIGNNDLWIAAHALALGHTLVSNNTREFARIEGLKLENWV